jgi:transposase-like protein
MRREGLYSSTVSGWRRQRERDELAALTPKKRGRKAKPKDPRDKLISEKQREIKRLEKKLATANTIIEIQKKVSSLLGIPLNSPEFGEDD